MENRHIKIVKPGDGVVTGKHIHPYTNSWEMTTEHPDGAITNRGSWNDEVSFFVRDGKEILFRKQTISYTDRKVLQVDEADKETLSPIRVTINTLGEEPHTDILYKDKQISGKKVFRVEGHDTIEEIPIPFSYELSHPIFDWHLWGILISGFPLQAGYAARFLAHESYSYLPGDFRWFTLNVTGTEEIDCGKWRYRNCWVVNVKAEVSWVIWIAIDKEIAPVQKIRIEYIDGSILWWKPAQVNQA